MTTSKSKLAQFVDAEAAASSSLIPLDAQSSIAESSASDELQSYTDPTELENSEEDPPAYTEHEDLTLAPEQITSHFEFEPLRMSEYEIPGGRVVTSKREGKTYTVSLASYLSSNADVLCKFFRQQAKLPPLVFVSVKGTHTISRRNGDKQISTETVTDFDFMIDGSNTVLWRGRDLHMIFRKLKIIQDNDGVSAYRGGRFKSTNPSRCLGTGNENALEGGDHPSSEQTLEEWCQRFCNDKSVVKSFTLHRDLMDWNFEFVKREIRAMIRSTNYRGRISISPFIKQSRVTIYSPSLINRLRTNNIVWWTCVILQLWIITWPLLILLERKYEVVRVENYPMPDRSGSPFERKWVSMLSPAIKSAALNKRKNETVTIDDNAEAIDMFAERANREEERERQRRMNRGEATWTDSVIGIVRGVSDAAWQWNDERGWGYDE